MRKSKHRETKYLRKAPSEPKGQKSGNQEINRAQGSHKSASTRPERKERSDSNVQKWERERERRENLNLESPSRKTTTEDAKKQDLNATTSFIVPSVSKGSGSKTQRTAKDRDQCYNVGGRREAAGGDRHHFIVGSNKEESTGTLMVSGWQQKRIIP